MVFEFLFERRLIPNRTLFEVLPDDILIIILRKAFVLHKDALVWKFEPFSRMAPYLLRTVSFSDDTNKDEDLSIARIGTKDKDFMSKLKTYGSVFETLEIDSSYVFDESDARVLKSLCKQKCTLQVAFKNNSDITLEKNIMPVLETLGASFGRINIVRPLHGIDEFLDENSVNIRNMLLNFSFENLKSFQYTGQDLEPVSGVLLWKKLGGILEEISVQVYKGKTWCRLLTQIGTHCRNLRIIDVDNPFDDIEMTQEIYVDFLSSYGNNLVQANLVFSQFINQPQWRTERILSKLVNSCANFRCNWHEFDEEVPDFHRVDILGKHIQSLRLHAFRSNAEQKHLSMRNCTSMKELTISSDPGSLSCESFQDVFDGFPGDYNQLEILTFHNVLYGANFLDVLNSSKISHLKHLKMYSLTMSTSTLGALGTFIDNNQKLESIFLVEHASESSQDTLEIVAKLVSLAETCKNLKKIEVYFVHRNMPQVVEMQRCCTRLRLYLVAYTFAFSDSHIKN